MTARLRAAGVIISDGQSNATMPSSALAFGAIVAAYHPDYVNRTVAHSGTSWAERAVTAPGRVDRWARAGSGPTILLDCGGNNEINSANSAAVEIAAAESYWQARKDAGFDFVIATTIPDAIGMYDAGEQAKKATMNAAFIASTVLDGYVDLSVITAGGLDFDDYTNTTTFQGDGIHFTAAAAEAVGDAFEAVIVGLI